MEGTNLKWITSKSANSYKVLSFGIEVTLIGFTELISKANYDKPDYI